MLGNVEELQEKSLYNKHRPIAKKDIYYDFHNIKLMTLTILE